MGLFETGGNKGWGRFFARGASAALLLSAALTAAMVSGCAGKSEDLGKDVIATVGGERITVDDYKYRVGGNIPVALEDRRKALKYMISIRLASKAALDKGMLGDPEVFSELEIFYSEQLPGLLKKKIAEGVTVTDEEVAAFMPDVKPSLSVSILSAQTLEEAQAAVAEVGKGTKFEDVPGKLPSVHLYNEREVSLDDALYPVGVRAVLNGLKPGGISPAMKMDIGYVVFKLKSRTEPEDMKAAAEKGVREKLKQDKVNKMMDELLVRLENSADIKLKSVKLEDGETQYTGATVDGIHINMNMDVFNKATGDPHAPHVSMTSKTLKDALKGAIDGVLLSAEAKRRGVQYGPEFTKVVAWERENILSDAYMGKVKEKIATSDEDVLAYFNKNKEMFRTPPQVKVGRMLLNTREDAEAALKELDAGKKFADVARARSADPTVDKNGGDVGYVEVAKLKEPLKTAISRLKAGEHTGVLKTDYGFEIIEATELKPSGIPEVTELTDTIKKRVVLYKRGDALGKAYDELQKKYTVKVNEDLLKSMK